MASRNEIWVVCMSGGIRWRQPWINWAAQQLKVKGMGAWGGLGNLNRQQWCKKEPRFLCVRVCAHQMAEEGRVMRMRWHRIKEGGSGWSAGAEDTWTLALQRGLGRCSGPTWGYERGQGATWARGAAVAASELAHSGAGT